MTPNPTPREVEEALERARAAIAAGSLTVEVDEEAELHAPLTLRRRDPVEIDPESEAALETLLGSQRAR